MKFADFYNLLEETRKKIKKEKQVFENELLNMEKKEIILEFLEIYIYNRLNIFFQYVEKQARNDDYLFNIEEMKKISQIDNFLSFIKKNYFKGEIYQDNLSNNDLQKYFKSI